MFIKNSEKSELIDSLTHIVGRSNVHTSSRATTPYSTGTRFGGGKVLAVIRPGDLVEMWRALQVCVESDLIVIPQAANTGLTGGSNLDNREYDRDVVIFSTTRIKQIVLINDAREAICFAGARLYELESILESYNREPHSVIGSTSVGASVVGGIANNSGGSQIRKGPAFTAHALYARVNEVGRAELINHLGVSLGSDPVRILEKLQRDEWRIEDVTSSPADSYDTEYSKQVREVVDTPARFNANPKYLFEASGSAGKVLVFAVRVRTFPKHMKTHTFYIGSNRPAELEKVRRRILASKLPLPVSAEYIGRPAFDLAVKYGRDTLVCMKYAGSRQLVQLFRLKSWANGVFSKFPFLAPAFADIIAQAVFRFLPFRIPPKILKYRDSYEHHLILTVDSEETPDTERILKGVFREPESDGSFFICTPREAQSAMLLRFGAASAITRYHNVHRRHVAGMVTFDVALRRNEDDWFEELPYEVSEQLEVSAYYGHFFCHVMHQNHVVRAGVDTVQLKETMTELLVNRGATIPAEHNFGRLYQAPDQVVAHLKALDPCNVFNAGVGKTSTLKSWA